MEQWVVVLSATLAVFGVVALGGVLRGVGWLTPAADASLLRLVIWVFFPALIIKSIVGNPALDQGVNLWLPPVVGFASVAGGMLVAGLFAWLVGPWIGLTSTAMQRTFAFSVGLHNYGYLPVPLAESLYGQGTPTLGVLFVNNVGVDLAMWTLGVAVLSGSGGLSSLRKAINGPSLAVVAAILLHFAGAAQWWPTGLTKALTMLGNCAVPVALLLIGATIVEAYRREDHATDVPAAVVNLQRRTWRERGWGVMVSGCLLRLGLLPLGFVLTAWFLPSIGGTDQMQRVLILHAAMPAAVFPIVLARHYGGDPRTAARVSIATSVVSLITMPLWLAGATAWLNPAG